jgi:hypothetical protein
MAGIWCGIGGRCTVVFDDGGVGHVSPARVLFFFPFIICDGRWTMDDGEIPRNKFSSTLENHSVNFTRCEYFGKSVRRRNLYVAFAVAVNLVTGK